MASSATAFVRAWKRFDSAPARALGAVLTCTGIGIYEAIPLTAFTDKDIWWHLRTGPWISENHAIPRTALFSQQPSATWIDCSWGFDLLTGAAYRIFGLGGLPIVLLLLQVAIAVALFRLARTLGSGFWSALVLSALAQACLFPSQLRPGLCSIAFFAAELALLLRSRQTGQARSLLWLPLIFLLWANLDRQFTYGLLTLALFCVTVLGQRTFSRPTRENSSGGMPYGALGMAAGGSLLAAFVSPYGYRLPVLLWQSALDSAADRYFRELHAMRFRQPQDYIILLLMMTAFFALGRRRSRDFFLYTLLILSAAISFRLQRDTWLVVVVAVAVIADAVRASEDKKSTAENLPERNWVIPGLATVVLAIIGLCRVPARVCMLKIRENFPVRACDSIRRQHLPQPLFNIYPWGGFLTWYLPEYPVSIDGRTDLYGDEINIGYFKLVQAEIPLQSYAAFAQAKTMLLESNSALTQALKTLPNFRVVYEDDQATVIVRID